MIHSWLDGARTSPLDTIDREDHGAGDALGGGVAPRIPRGFWFGEAVYETLLVRRGATRLPALWRLHRARFAEGAGRFQLPWPGDDALDRQLLTALTQLPHTDDADWWRVRLTLAATGPDAPMLAPDAASLWIDARPAVMRIRPAARMAIGPKLRNPDDPLARTKRVTLASDLAAVRRAVAAGWDDVILLDVAGCISEASTSALVFGFEDGTLGSPGFETAALPSTTLQLLRDAGHRVRPLQLRPEALGTVRWAAALNAVQGARPVCAIDRFELAAPPDSFVANVRALVDGQRNA